MATTSTNNDDLYPGSRRPVKQSVGQYIWNSNTHEFLGRTGTSWAKIGIFYVFFYLFLAGFFSLAFFVFYQTIDLERPSYVGVDDSILKNVGLGSRPQPVLEDQQHNLFYSAKVDEASKGFTKEIQEVMYRYATANKTGSYRDCSRPLPKNATPEQRSKLCGFKPSSLNTTCTKANGWGYGTNSPCILFKINKMMDFMPEPVKDPKTLPQDLQDYIKMKKINVTTNLFVWCETPDKHVVLEQNNPAFSLEYFPYKNQKGFVQQLSMVRVSNVTIGEPTKLTCELHGGNFVARLNNRNLSKTRYLIKVTEAVKKDEV